MGSIKRFNLDLAIRQYDAPVFFETGTWRGDGLAYACKAPFHKLLSVEIIPELAEKARERFAGDQRVEIIESDSIQAFEDHLDVLSENIIFWLDAHYPGAEEGLAGYDAELGAHDRRLPLEMELELIYNKRRHNRDLIIIDDLRIYEQGNYESGNLPVKITDNAKGKLNPAISRFESTHEIIRLKANEGYLVLRPKDVKRKASITDRLKNKLQQKLF